MASSFDQAFTFVPGQAAAGEGAVFVHDGFRQALVVKRYMTFLI